MGDKWSTGLDGGNPVIVLIKIINIILNSSIANVLILFMKITIVNIIIVKSFYVLFSTFIVNNIILSIKLVNITIDDILPLIASKLLPYH